MTLCSEKYCTQVEIGRIKNPSHNPVAEKAIEELESELNCSTNSPYRHSGPLNFSSGMSAREMWFQRDQYANEQLPIDDFKTICEQHSQ